MAAVRALAKDGALKPPLDEEAATDLLWMILSVENWERLVRECNWPQERYIEIITKLAEEAVVKT